MKKQIIILALIVVLTIVVPPTTIFANNNVNYVVQPTLKFHSVGPFKDGLTKVMDIKDHMKEKDGTMQRHFDTYYGYLNTRGELAIPMIYDYAEDFSEGYALVAKGETYAWGRTWIDTEPALTKVISNWGFIDNTGKEAIPLIYKSANSFSEGLAFVVTSSYERGYIDREGNLVINTAGYFYEGSFSEGRASVKKDDTYGFIDKQGELVIPCIYDAASHFSDGLSSAKFNGKCGYIDRNGEVVIPFIYDSAYPFSEGYALVIKGDKKGYINKQGNMTIILDENQWGTDFSEGLAVILTWSDTKPDSYGYIDTTGKMIIPSVYSKSFPFSEGLALVSDSHSAKTGYIDKTGTRIIPLIFDTDIKGLSYMRDEKKDHPGNFSEGFAWIYSSDVFWYDGKRGIIVNPLTSNSHQTAASPSTANVILNDKEVDIKAYNINGNNYFMLRELATALLGTSAGFNIEYDSKIKTIRISSNSEYFVEGNLLKGDVLKKSSAAKSKDTILLDEKLIDIEAYNINGNNYFKLRDLGEAINFHVEWNPTTKAIIINTNKSYKSQ